MLAVEGLYSLVYNIALGSVNIIGINIIYIVTGDSRIGFASRKSGSFPDSPFPPGRFSVRVVFRALSTQYVF